MRNVLLYFFVFLLAQVAGGIMMAILKPLFASLCDESAEFYALVVAEVISCVLALIVFFKYGWCKVSMGFVRSKPWNVLILTMVAAIACLAPSVWVEEFLPDSMQENIASDVFETILSNPLGYIVVGVIAPIIEEVVFRGAILRKLLEVFSRNGEQTRQGTWKAIVVSAAMFSLAHLNPAQIPHAFLLGILLGWLCVRTGSIVPSMLFHWVNNTVAMLLVMACPELDENAKLIEYFGGDEMAMLSCVGVSAVVLVISIILLDRKMKTA